MLKARGAKKTDCQLEQKDCCTFPIATEVPAQRNRKAAVRSQPASTSCRAAEYGGTVGQPLPVRQGRAMGSNYGVPQAAPPYAGQQVTCYLKLAVFVGVFYLPCPPLALCFSRDGLLTLQQEADLKHATRILTCNSPS